jgi:uncharacterized C2H2 Zn-finger protein
MVIQGTNSLLANVRLDNFNNSLTQRKFSVFFYWRWCFLPAKKTNEQFLQEIVTLVGDEYTFLEEYTTSNKKIKVRHNICGFEYKVTPSHFFSGRRCPKCSKRLKRTLEMFKQEVFDSTGGEYIVTDTEYSHKGTKIKHLTCGIEYTVIPTEFRKGRRCAKCQGLIKTTEEYIIKINEVHGNEFTVLGEYVNAKIKTKVRHNVCGYEWYCNLFYLAKGHGCPKCGNAIKKTNEEFLNEVERLVGNEYSFLEEYKGALEKIKVMHNVCQHQYEVTPANFLYGFRCPKCNQSKSEKRIYDLLSCYNIKFIPQYKFDDCRYINPLPFDFAVFDKQNNLIFLIEYDGELHFNSVEQFGGEEALALTKIRDNIKTNYCQQNNLNLIRISYMEKNNLDTIIINLLKKNNLILDGELIAI